MQIWDHAIYLGDDTLRFKMLHFISHPDYDIPLPKGHRFPARKFTSLMDRLIKAGVVKGGRLSHARPAPKDPLAKVHAPHYIQAIAEGTLNKEALRQLGLPWSEALAKRSFLAVEGTYRTALKALDFGLACHGAGGTHHAHHDYGAGFCVFNDMAYTARRLIDEGRVQSVLILDVDVHQGDGTARILAGDDAVFTCSLHCADNYPHDKALSDLDVLVPAGTGDAGYGAILQDTLDNLAQRLSPDLVIYDAGVDVHEADALGRLALTDAGVMAREDMVLEYWLSRGVPVATVIGGGYMPDFDHLMRLHMMVFQAAKDQFKRWC